MKQKEKAQIFAKASVDAIKDKRKKAQGQNNGR